MIKLSREVTACGLKGSFSGLVEVILWDNQPMYVIQCRYPDGTTSLAEQPLDRYSHVASETDKWVDCMQNIVNGLAGVPFYSSDTIAKGLIDRGFTLQK